VSAHVLRSYDFSLTVGYYMAIFGAPLSFGNDAANAVRAALEIVERVQREVEAQAIPPARIGIGLHAGEVLAGPVGSAVHSVPHLQPLRV